MIEIQPAPARSNPAASAEPLQLLVHKREAAEVLLTGWYRCGPDAFTVTAHWPASHRFYESRCGTFDPMLFAETVRQSSLLISHAAYEVPLGHQLIWEEFSYAVDPSAMRADRGPAVVELRLACSDIVRRSARMAAVTMDLVALSDGVEIGTARLSFTSNPPAVYKRLRSGRADPVAAMAAAGPAAPAIPPAAVARERRRDVVLSDADPDGVSDGGPRARWLLRTDTSHPVLFDHVVDHVPGMLLLEAARQAALARTSLTRAIPARCDSTFFQYVEFDAPCRIVAEPTLPDERGRPRVEVVALQAGAVAFSCVVTLEAQVHELSAA
ncbi:gamma-butyrolactone biosynthesis enzyme (plasmid) [Streptomyces sp. NBC_01351]|uniref:ScbA/BarX family gamma-butyrolactone biosynthesis protein n=1 Tax=Streptomyces sp. NBC_01351 TaxID=2903833 RepID=UPI002E323365|nr:ScbA/BarX family gamma-butyrolactone biosynthesis protein [Streptomyces sp. NBC_01351]